MGTGTGRSINCDVITIGKPSSESVSIPCDSSPSPNDIYVEETEREGGGPVLYCSFRNFLLDFGVT